MKASPSGVAASGSRASSAAICQSSSSPHGALGRSRATTRRATSARQSAGRPATAEAHSSPSSWWSAFHGIEPRSTDRHTQPAAAADPVLAQSPATTSGFTSGPSIIRQLARSTCPRR